MTPAETKLKNIKEELFKWSMELEDLAGDIGYPHKNDIEECAANIQEQCDTLEAMLSDD